MYSEGSGETAVSDCFAAGGGEFSRSERGGRKKPPRKTPGQCFADGELTRDELLDKARESALRTLTASAKSRAELNSGLTRKGYPQDVIESLLDRLTEVGLIDDSAYAMAITRSRFTERGLSRRAIAGELKRRGIDPEISQMALGQLDPQSEQQAALLLAQKLARKSDGLDQKVRLQRLVSALARRGYESPLIFEVAREALRG